MFRLVLMETFCNKTNIKITQRVDFIELVLVFGDLNLTQIW